MIVLYNTRSDVFVACHAMPFRASYSANVWQLVPHVINSHSNDLKIEPRTGLELADGNSNRIASSSTSSGQMPIFLLAPTQHCASIHTTLTTTETLFVYGEFEKTA
jgi:hypothetical protein